MRQVIQISCQSIIKSKLGNSLYSIQPYKRGSGVLRSQKANKFRRNTFYRFTYINAFISLSCIYNMFSVSYNNTYNKQLANKIGKYQSQQTNDGYVNPYQNQFKFHQDILYLKQKSK